MNSLNYSKEMDKITATIDPAVYRPRLLLHSCCAPCSSYCLVYLRQWFDITCFYYNPNITDKEEFEKRQDELVRLVGMLNMEAGRNESPRAIKVIKSTLNPADFYNMSKGLENVPEGGVRCHGCFNLRINKTFEMAAKGDYDYVTTTLTISPLKDAALINKIGLDISRKYDIKWLFSDFKKKDGYKKSIELSERYGLYRQNYCGCEYSKR